LQMDRGAALNCHVVHNWDAGTDDAPDDAPDDAASSKRKGG